MRRQSHPIVPLATVHKARLQWLDATDDMLAESRAFLFDHGYEALPNIRAYVKDPGLRAGETRPCPAQGPRMSRAFSDDTTSRPCGARLEALHKALIQTIATMERPQIEDGSR